MKVETSKVDATRIRLDIEVPQEMVKKEKKQKFPALGRETPRAIFWKNITAAWRGKR